MSMSLSMLGLAAALSASPASAQEDSDGESAAQDSAKESSAEGGLTLEGPYAKKPYAKPVVGAMVWEDAVGISLGAEAGIKYNQKKSDPAFFGKTRVVGSVPFGAGFSGYQVNDSTTELRRQDSSALVWGAAGVGLGLLLLGAAAVLLATLS